MRTGNTYHNAKTILARWLDRTDAGPQHRRAVLAGFDRLRGELPNRDRWFDTNTVTLEGTEGLRAEAARLRLRVGTWRGGLFITTITPGWGVGWHTVFRGDDVYDVLWWLMDYVRQYVHRSLVVGALMAIQEDRGIVLHPFGSSGHIRRWGPRVPIVPYDEALSIAGSDAVSWPVLSEDLAVRSDRRPAPADGTPNGLCSA